MFRSKSGSRKDSRGTCESVLPFVQIYRQQQANDVDRLAIYRREIDASLRRASIPNGLFTPSNRACGTATPSPVPVDPSYSRFNKALSIIS